jgi:hypothetical protein
VSVTFGTAGSRVKTIFHFQDSVLAGGEPIQRVPVSPDLAQFDSTFWDQIQWQDYSVKTLTVADLQQLTETCQYIT